MNYDEALKFIHESHKFGMRLGLENIKKLLELLGNPQNNLKIILEEYKWKKIQILLQKIIC